MEIKKVIICGLGALGLTYADKLRNICELKILANEERILKYKNNTPIFNGKKIELDYITPNESWDPDLIIIATKSTGLDSAISYIKNYVTKKTIILSLINGITSEEQIASVYGKEKVIKSYFIGHSAIRNDNETIQDGNGKIVFEKNNRLESFFKKNNINYETPANIEYSIWIKFGVNTILNIPSAIYESTVGELKKNPEYMPLAKELLEEVYKIAHLEGVKNLDNYKEEVLASIELISDSGTTSMLQDIKAGRKTEIDIFAGEIIRLGKKHNIPTPYNQKVYNLIKIKEG